METRLSKVLKRINLSVENPDDYIDRDTKEYKQDPDGYFTKNQLKFKDDETVIDKVKSVMKLSPMEVVQETKDFIIYQHPDLPVFYMKFSNDGRAESIISTKQYNDDKKVIVKEESVDKGTQEEIYKIIDKISYVTGRDVKELLKPRMDRRLKEALEYFIKKSWLQ